MVPDAVVLWGIWQTVHSALLWFLFLFALRNQFKTGLPAPWSWSLHHPLRKYNGKLSTESRGELAQAVNRLEDRIERLQMNPTLDNFDGIVAVRLCDASHNDLPLFHGEERAIPHAAPGQSCLAIVGFETEIAENTYPFCSRVVIKDGKPSNTVSFDVALDSEIITFEPRGARFTFSSSASERFDRAFAFVAPLQAGREDIFIEVTQKNRLVQVVAATLMVVQ